MFELIAPDWVTYWPWYLAGTVGFLVVYQAITCVLRWRRGEPLFERSDLGDTARTIPILMFVLGLTTISAQKWPWWVEFPATGFLFALLFAWATLVSTVRRLLGMVPSPPDAPEPYQHPHLPVPVELKIAAAFLLPLVAYGASLFGALWYLKNHVLGTGPQGPDTVGLALVAAWCFGLPLLVAFGRWPRAVAQAHNLTILASPQAVWDAIHLRATETYYRASTVRYEALDATGRRLRWHHRDLSQCGRCGLPQAPDKVAQTALCEILEQVNGVSQTFRTTQPDLPSWRRMHSLELETFAIAAHPGGTEITFSSVVEGPRLFLLPLFISGNIPRDILWDLKAFLEGTRGYGVFDTGRQMLAAIRAAPAHCSCAPRRTGTTNGPTGPRKRGSIIGA